MQSWLVTTQAWAELSRWLLILTCSALLAAEAEPVKAGETSPGTVVDRPVRFVNDQVLTIGDIRTRNGTRVEMYRRAGKVLPDNRDGLLRFNRDTLEELTDEELMVQKANELKVDIDRDRLSTDVIAEARSRGLALRDIAVLRRVREREAKIDAVLGWVESRTSAISPKALRASYDQRLVDFARPARARSLLIALRPTADDERKELVTGLAGLMREAQQSTDEAMTKAAAGRLDAFLAADRSGQEVILAELADVLASQVQRTDLGKAPKALAEQAAELLKRWHGVRTRQQCEDELSTLRDQLMALPADKRAEVFMAKAKAISQGPQATEGGLIGWVEPGTFGKEIEAQALTAPPLEPTTPFWTAGSTASLLVLEREAGRTQSFAEVSAALQASLERDRRSLLRKRVTNVLRSQASVHDVIDLGVLLQ